MTELVHDLVDAYRLGRLDRRSLIRRALVLGVSAPALGGLLAACAPAAPSQPPPTAQPQPIAAPTS